MAIESSGAIESSAAAAEGRHRHRVRAQLSARAFGVVAALALLVSTQVLFQPHLFEMWEPLDIALAWAEYFAEVLLIGWVLLIAVALAEQAPVDRPAARAALLASALLLPVVGLVLLFARYHSGAWSSSWASPLVLIGESIKYSLFGAFVFGVRALHRRAERADAEARTVEAARRDLDRQAEEAQLRLLQAQIEPHFLFNTLANVRRLYRTRPSAGAEMIDSLMVYLRAALPQVRRSASTLGEEFELVQAYLQLFRVRMGPRLRYTLDLPPGLRGAAFPPMALVTLAENAIKHGIAPADLGGSIRIDARRTDTALEVTVCDDGVGFGPTASGTGVGLVNTRRQLAARYGDAARLTLEQQAGGGICARIAVPWDGAEAPLPLQPAAAVE